MCHLHYASHHCHHVNITTATINSNNNASHPPRCTKHHHHHHLSINYDETHSSLYSQSHPFAIFESHFHFIQQQKHRHNQQQLKRNENYMYRDFITISILYVCGNLLCFVCELLPSHTKHIRIFVAMYR